MSGSSSVPRPVFGLAGFVAPVESAILAGVQQGIDAAFRGGLNPALETPQGQLASSMTAMIGDKNDQFLFYTNQVDPAYAAGRMQDGIARIYFITRDPARPTTVQAVCVGLAGRDIPIGAQAKATDGNLYTCTQGGTIPVSGSITLPFACAVTGPIACPDGSLNEIYQLLPGWDTINNPAEGVIGNDVESRAAFEARRSASVAINGQGSLPSVLGAVLAVPNVLDAYATQNDTAATVTRGGATLGPNSLYVAASGGDPQAIATAIWTKKSVGCNTVGNTTETVVDANYDAPQPSYQISFEVPTPTPVLFVVTLANSAGVPSNATALVQNALISAFSGADGGPRARIGSTIYASRFYSTVAALGSWAQIVSIEIGVGTADQNSVTMQINQVPAIAAGNITLTLV